VVTTAIRPAAPGDAAAIAAIYNEGIEDRVATFETRPRDAGEVAEWIAGGLPFVVAENGGIVGFARVSPYSDRCVYAGIGEVGIQRRHGRLDGEWKDCVLVERLLGEAAA
jgi:L-amino acid N-acyltransferase YncA